MALTWTYDAEQLAASELFRVRRRIGDVNVAGGATTTYFSDQEITFAITDAGDETSATIRLLRDIAVIYADKATVATGSQRIELGKISAQYSALADGLENRERDDDSVQVAAMIPVDGFSQDIASDEVCAVDTSLGHSEYCGPIDGTW